MEPHSEVVNGPFLSPGPLLTYLMTEYIEPRCAVHESANSALLASFCQPCAVMCQGLIRLVSVDAPNPGGDAAQIEAQWPKRDAM